MQQYFGKIEAFTDIGDVLRYAADICLEQQVVRYSYHFTPLFEAPNSPGTAVVAEGFSREWLDLYEQADFRAKDPIPVRTLQHGSMLSWQDAISYAPNTRENEEYFAAMAEFGLVHGFGLPLFGPRGRDAYASFDFGMPITQIDGHRLGIVRSVPQAAHQRVSVLLDSMDDRPELSEREREVMSWVARGKSISAIATILDIAPDTVKTYTKRIYAKLDVSDRVGATVKALKLGLVQV
ncbi:LuxR family transcriptional regulator [Erythrobacter sp. JK5]|uniref:helix-turn-helix transcriptional regulator n=1 Tax=Erythrobacter sp. JK5 TaxID=2829500 RepID=UPI001BA97D7B|nr:LuxR family transcriptional regulator [Erythrobacter sp. JK5]QUL38770.1 autoinducer binding domain-containing protein [Erythrobacter sp. JK5]